MASTVGPNPLGRRLATWSPPRPRIAAVTLGIDGRPPHRRNPSATLAARPRGRAGAGRFRRSWSHPAWKTPVAGSTRPTSRPATPLSAARRRGPRPPPQLPAGGASYQSTRPGPRVPIPEDQQPRPDHRRVRPARRPLGTPDRHPPRVPAGQARPVPCLDVPGAKGARRSTSTTAARSSASTARTPRWSTTRPTRVISCGTGAGSPPSRSPARTRVRTEPLRRSPTTAARWSAPTSTSSGALHGFLLERGRITTIDPAGATSTSPTAINDRGQVLGVYTDAAGAFHGFVLSRGRFISFDAPDRGDFLLPLDINNRGQIVGYTVRRPGHHGPAPRGFLLAKGARGSATPISFPGAPRTIATGHQRPGADRRLLREPRCPAKPTIH